MRNQNTGYVYSVANTFEKKALLKEALKPMKRPKQLTKLKF